MDLLIIIVCSLVMIPAVYSSSCPFLAGLGLALLFLFPGYVLLLLFFPRQGALSGLERMGLAIGSSVASVIVFEFLLSVSGLDFNVILVLLDIVVILAAGFAYWRRWRIPAAERFALRFNFGRLKRLGWKWETVAAILTVVVLFSALGGAARAVTSLRMTDRFTEFYITEDDIVGITKTIIGEADTPLTLELSVVNHEAKTMEYHVHWIGEGIDASIEGYRAGDTFVLADGEKWERPIQLLPTEMGTGRRLILYLDAAETEQYRMLSLFMDVLK